MALEGPLAPAEVTIFISDLDEQPAGLDSEVLDGLDLGHCEWEGSGKGGCPNAQRERRQFQVAELIPGVIYEDAHRVSKTPSSILPLPPTIAHRMDRIYPHTP